MSETDEPVQGTPTGAEIPIPTRADVFRDLRKVAKAPVDDESDEGAGSAGEQE